MTQEDGAKATVVVVAAAMRHPIQPLVTENGVVRFRANAIVRHLLDHGGIDMNALARMTFSDEDRAQFAQLIGYSLSGYGSLGYVSDDAYRAAEAMVDGTDERDARIDTLTVELTELRDSLREPMARLFGVCAEDLGGEE